MLQIGPGQPALVKRGFMQVRVAESRPAQHGKAEVALPKVGISQIGLVQKCMAEVRPPQVRFGQESPVSFQITQGRFLQLSSFDPIEAAVIGREVLRPDRYLRPGQVRIGVITHAPKDVGGPSPDVSLVQSWSPESIVRGAIDDPYG